MTQPSQGAAGPVAGRTYIIINPAAGQDEPERLKRSLGAAFAARDASFDIAMTEYSGHASELARRAAGEGYRAVAVVGGDGTLAEAATGLAGTNTPLAIIPRGTANQVAQNLRIPIELEHAVDVAVNGIVTPVDLGRIDDRAFALVAGAGFDAAVMATATRELKERWGFGAYVYAAVKEALSATPTRFHIRADGKEFDVDAVSVMVANVGELFPAFIPLRFALGPRPTSSWHDGLLDVVILAPRTPPDFAMILWRAARHRFPGDDRMIHFQATEITIDADPAIAVQIDGDPAGTTPVTAAALPSALKVILPAPEYP
ncbi:MAG: diacylglycerol/lipid kinase family protein [Longimicrobiales bacterium]